MEAGAEEEGREGRKRERAEATGSSQEEPNEVEQEEAQQVARVGVREDQPDPANRLFPPPGVDQ